MTWNFESSCVVTPNLVSQGLPRLAAGLDSFWNIPPLAHRHPSHHTGPRAPASAASRGACTACAVESPHPRRCWRRRGRGMGAAPTAVCRTAPPTWLEPTWSRSLSWSLAHLGREEPEQGLGEAIKQEVAGVGLGVGGRGWEGWGGGGGRGRHLAAAVQSMPSAISKLGFPWKWLRLPEPQFPHM